MRGVPTITATLFLLVAFSGGLQKAEAQGSSDLAGGWLVTSWTNPDGTVNSEPQRGLFLFTEQGQYSIMYVAGNEPRALLEDPTDADIAAAYSPFIANSGRYVVSGNEITYEAYVAKNPNYMADWNLETSGNARRMGFTLEDSTLTLQFLNAEGAVAATATLRRPGGA